MTFLPGQRVRILAERTFEDDPPRGTLASVHASDENGGGTEVTYPGGGGTYFDDELGLVA